MDHLSIIKPWVEIMDLDTRKIPTEKELDKALKEFEGIKYTWNDMEVLKLNKKGKKVEIHMKKNRNKLGLSWAKLSSSWD